MSEYGPTHNAEASKPLGDWRDAEIERLRRELDYAKVEIEQLTQANNALNTAVLEMFK
jgi:hypothetical protein